MNIMKDLRTCLRLVKYGKQANISRVCGIVCLVIGLISIAAAVSEGNIELAFFPSYFMCMGMIFFLQPLLSLCYKGVMSFAPQRRAAETLWTPLLIIFMVTATAIIAGAFGAVFSRFVPQAAKAASYAMITVLPIAVLTGSVIMLSKLSMKAYTAVFLIYIIAPQGLLSSMTDLAEIFPLGGSLTASFFIILGCGIIISLISYILCRALYKKPYGEAFRKMNDWDI